MNILDIKDEISTEVEFSYRTRFGDLIQFDCKRSFRPDSFFEIDMFINYRFIRTYQSNCGSYTELQLYCKNLLLNY